MKKDLYDLVAKKGEGLYPNYQICQIYDGFKVYHNKGYCFEILALEDVEGLYYHYYNEWEGFEKIDCETAIKLINNENSSS